MVKPTRINIYIYIRYIRQIYVCVKCVFVCVPFGVGYGLTVTRLVLINTRTVLMTGPSSVSGEVIIIQCKQKGKLNKGADLDIPDEVSELHIVLDDKVHVEAPGGDGVLLLEGGAVADPRVARVVFHVSGWRDASLCFKSAQK